MGDGWFLKHVEVVGPGGERVCFPCNAWLGESDCGGLSGACLMLLASVPPAVLAAVALQLHSGLLRIF